MSTIKPYILSVDDEQLNQHIVTELLEEDFELGLAYNGQECLDLVAKRKPEVILLDVNMPVLDGLETCKKLRANLETKDIIIIFVSALVSSKQRLAGYEAGGDDYITKPFEEDELIAKIHLFLKQITQQKVHQKELHQHIEGKQLATTTAMSAMLSSSELGLVLQFMQSIITSTSIEQLHQHVQETFDGYELSGCVMLCHQEEPLYLFSDHIDRPIEQDILREAHNKGRIISFSGRAIFNSKHASMLIRKMPMDEEKNGRFRDHLAVMVDAIEEKIIQFIADRKRNEHFYALESIVNTTAKKLHKVKKSSEEQRALNTKVLSNLSHTVEESFLTLGLDESQEDQLREMLESAEAETDKIYERGKEASDTFNQIVEDLSALIEK